MASQSLFNLSFADETNVIHQYLLHDAYPEDLSHNQKRALRKRAEVFSLTEDKSFVLYKGRRGREERTVVTSPDEQLRKLRTIHEGFGGRSPRLFRIIHFLAADSMKLTCCLSIFVILLSSFSFSMGIYIIVLFATKYG